MTKRVATYLVRVNLTDHTEEGEPTTRDLTPPTNTQLESWIRNALYSGSNFYNNEIGVESERVDE